MLPIKECIYSKYYGGKWYYWICSMAHVWKNIHNIKVDNLTIEQNKCIHCDRVENMILIDWYDPKRKKNNV